MLELLKKIGVPATVAAVIASLVTTVPFLFKVDERYAKADELEKVVSKLEKRIDDQNRELAQLSGFQSAMVTFIQEGRLPRQPIVTSTPAPVVPAPTPVAAAAPPAPELTSPEVLFKPNKPAVAIAKPASAPIEQPRNWRELNEGLVRQQSRLISN